MQPRVVEVGRDTNQGVEYRRRNGVKKKTLSDLFCAPFNLSTQSGFYIAPQGIALQVSLVFPIQAFPLSCQMKPKTHIYCPSLISAQLCLNKPLCFFQTYLPLPMALFWAESNLSTQRVLSHPSLGLSPVNTPNPPHQVFYPTSKDSTSSAAVYSAHPLHVPHPMAPVACNHPQVPSEPQPTSLPRKQSSLTLLHIHVLYLSPDLSLVLLQYPGLVQAPLST